MQILPSQPASIAKILDASINLYVTCFGKLINLFLVLAAFFIALGLFTDLLLMPPEPGFGDSADQETFILARLPLLLAVVFCASIASFVLYIAMIHRIDNVVQQREDSALEALQVGLNKFLPMLVAVVLYTLAIMIGSVLLLIPGIILSLSLAFYLYFIVIDDMGGYAALKASHQLVWGNWWRTAAVFTVPGIVLVVLYFGLFFVVGLLSAGFASIPGLESLINALTNLLFALITPYYFVLGYVQFQDLKLRKWGDDLAQRLTP